MKAQDLNETLQKLLKSLEAGSYNVAPSQLSQGAALQIEDLDAVMHNVTFSDEHIKLQKEIKVKDCKATTVQFNRQLSYGRFGGSAQREGDVGDYDVSDYVRVVVPMAFYSTLRRVTIAANLVQTFDNVSAEDREAASAAKKLAADIEFDTFRGKSNFSNNGIFDGNPLAIPAIPNMLGLDAQIRQSDIVLNTHDLMFDSYGSDQSVVLDKSGALDQLVIEDAHVRSVMNMGHADRLFVDPIVLAGYNKAVALGAGSATGSIQRIFLAGSAQEASGADLRRQWVSNGIVSLEASRFLSAKTSPHRPSIGSPAAPSIAVSAIPGGKLAAGTYYYKVTAHNIRGESPASNVANVTVAANGAAQITITPASSGPGGVTHFDVYRGTSEKTLKYIGSVKNDGAATTTFIDLGNKLPGFVTGFLLQLDTMAYYQLAPYSRLKLAISDLSLPEAHFRFLTLAVYEPRKNVLIDNLV